MSDDEQLGLEESIQFAKKYLEDLLSFFGLNTDIYATTSDGEVIELSVPSTHLNGFLIGQHGDTVRSLQYIGYPIRVRAVNVSDDDLTQKEAAWLAYAAHDPAVCQTIAQCAHVGTYSSYLKRQYTDNE